MTKLRIASLGGIAVAAASLAIIVSADLSPTRYGVAGLALGEPSTSCAKSHAEIALLARLRNGYSSAELGAQFAATASSEPNLFVIRGGDEATALQSLSSNPAVLKAGYLMAHTADTTLQSCNYRLTDNPRALALFQSIEPTMIQSGLISQVQIDDPSTMLFVTDDPTNPSHLFVAAVIASPLTNTSPGSLRPVVATVDRKSMQTLSVGAGNWY